MNEDYLKILTNYAVDCTNNPNIGNLTIFTGDVIMNNSTNINGSNNNIAIGANSVINQKQKTTNEIKEYINKNIPSEKQSRKQYYEQFKKHHNDNKLTYTVPISVDFYKLVRASGYKENDIGVRKWVVRE